jgi:hypothetical protein
MDLTGIISSIESSALGEWMRSYVKAMPIVESIHVMAVALLFGSILIVDLRLLGFANTRRAFTRVSDELLRYTWTAFVIAAITGAMMFTANAGTYFDNTAFRLKMLALLGAGVNMAVFHLVTAKTVPTWDRQGQAPPAGRVAGALSILIWVGVIFLGRWIGFTKGYDFSIPEDLDLDFDFFEASLKAGGLLGRVGL